MSHELKAKHIQTETLENKADDRIQARNILTYVQNFLSNLGDNDLVPKNYVDLLFESVGIEKYKGSYETLSDAEFEITDPEIDDLIVIRGDKSIYWYDGSSWEPVGGSTETPATIKTKYESNANTNAFTDAEKSKLAGLQNETGQSIADKYEAHEDVKRFTTALKEKVDGIETNGDGTKFKANDGTYKTIDALPSQTGNAGKVLKTNGSAASWEGLETSDINNLDTNLAGKESIANKGVAGGYAPLDATGKLPANMIPDSITGGVTYKGVWDASSGTAPNGSPLNGWYYKVSVAGTTNVDGNDEWNIGDWIIYNGTAWDRIQNSEQISSVQGQVAGDVVITDTNVDHQIGITIPAWISAIYTAGKASIRSVLDAIVSQITTMKNKLDGVENGATKNATDAQLRDRSTHTGKDPIVSIEGAEEADINTVVAKKNDGTYGWVNYSEPKPTGIRKADGSITYYDTLQQAMIASYADYEGNDYDIFEIYTDTEVDYQIYIGGNRILNLNGYSIYSTFEGDAIVIDGDSDTSRRSKIVNGATISGSTEDVLIKITTLYSGVRIFATIEAENGSGIESSSGFVLYGNITAKNTPIFSFQEPATIYGNVLSLESYGLDSVEGVVYGNVVTESDNFAAIRTNTLTSKLTIYGSVLIQNELSEAPAILFYDYQGGGVQTIEVEVAGSVIPAQGYAAAADTGTVHDLILTFLGMQSYAGSIEETTKPIIVNAKVPFPENGGGDGYETPEEVRDALSELTGENRLDASAIKNLPSTGLTPEQEAKLENTPLDTISELNNKVDKEEGKGLSSNDYTSAEKNKLENIEEDAQKNVQSDWNQEDSNSDDFIKNKPTLFSGSFDDLEDVPTSFPSTMEDVNGLENELGGLQDQITTNENKLEYVLNFPSDVLTYDFKETIDIKINNIKIEPESGQTVDLGGYILGETLEAYTVLSISVNQGGIIELIGERV